MSVGLYPFFFRPRRPLGWVEVHLYFSFLGPSALDGVGGQQYAPAASTPGKDTVPILQEAEWASGPVWTDGKFRSHRDSIPDRPARSQSLYTGPEP